MPRLGRLTAVLVLAGCSGDPSANGLGEPTAPLIAVSSSSVAFAATVGGSSPTSQVLAITNTGGGALTGLSAGPIGYGAGQPTGWLGLGLNSTTAPATLTLNVNTGALAAGTYTATVPVTATIASNSPQTVTVTFTVSARPAIALSSSTVAFVVTGGSNPPTQTVTIANSGDGTLSGLVAGPVGYGAGQPTGWLDVGLSGTTAPATLSMSVTTGALVPGAYTATIPVAATGASNSPRIVTVTLTVSAQPAIALSSSSVAFAATPGGGNPPAQSVTITNGGGGTLSGLVAGPVGYGAGQPTGWLDVGLSGTTAPATLSMSVTTGALVPGAYTATIPVAATGASNSPRIVTVTLTVSAQPAIALSSSSVSFAATVGGGNPPAQSVIITNGGGGTLNGLAAGPVGYGAGQPAGWLGLGLSGTSAPATLTLSVTTGALVAGTYTATVPVSATGASNSPRIVTISLTVSAQPTIALSSSSAAFAATAGGGNPASQSVTITNVGAGTLSGLGAGPIAYGVGQLTGWLGIGLNSTTAPATLTLTVTNGALVPSTYTAVVPVTASGASNSPQTLTVEFTVSAPPAIALSTSSVAFAATAGGGNPANQTVAITNSGGGSLGGLAVGPIGYGAGQPTGWLGVGLSSTTAPATLTLSVTTGALVAGTYSATAPVTASNATNSPQTVTVTFVVGTGTTTPAAPTSLTATAVAGNFAVALTWQDNATNETGFRIERCAGPGCSGFVAIAAPGPNVTSYQNVGLAAGTSYSYRVRASNAAGNSSYSNTAAASTPVSLPAGSLDPSFNTTGIVITAIPPGLGITEVKAVAIQSDGRIVAVGTANQEFAAARYNADGSLDASFGNGGIVTTNILTGFEEAHAVAIQADGRIVVAGIANNGTSSQVGDFAVVRYLANGSLDGSFGAGGKVTTDLLGNDDAARAVAIQADGKIVTGGYAYGPGSGYRFAVVRYNSDGTLDASFGVGGKVTTPLGVGGALARGIAIQSDGKIVAAGQGKAVDIFNNDFAIVRYNTNGTLDPSFGSGGVAITAVGTSDEVANAVAIQPNGKIVAAGFAYTGLGINPDYAIVRYNSDASLDMSFGTSGKVTTDLSGTNDFANAVAVQSDGKIVAAGYTGSDMSLVRYSSAGALDGSFGTGGKVITTSASSPSFGSRAHAIAIQSDGKIVIGGYASSGSGVSLVIGFGLVRYWP